MTNEYAIKVLTELRGYGDKFANIGFDRKEALDLAIKALEQQPCEDCINRKEVNVLVNELARAISDERCFMSRGRSTANIMQDILDLPSVTPTISEKETVEDCISREAVLEILEKEEFKGDAIYEIEKKLPPVTSTRPTSRWSRQTDTYHDYYECENCGMGVGLDDVRNFCPNCGAKMKSEE